MKRVLTLAILYLMLQGCASSLYKSIAPDDLNKVRNTQQVTLVFTQTPPMIMDTPADVLAASSLYSWANAPAGYSQGGSLWGMASQHFQLPKPAPILAKKVLEGLKNEAQLSNIQLVEQPFSLYEAWGAASEKLRPEYNDRFGNGYLLELRPLAYMMNYLPHKWSTYALVFRSQALLVNLQDNRVMWRGFCAAGGYEHDELRFNWKKMDDKEANRLKKGIELAAVLCAAQLVGQFQGKNTKP